MKHRCSYFCQDDMHVSCGLFAPDVTDAEILGAYQKAPCSTMDVVEIRPVRELDYAQWAAKMGYTIDLRTGTSQPKPAQHAMPAGWRPVLLVWRWREISRAPSA